MIPGTRRILIYKIKYTYNTSYIIYVVVWFTAYLLPEIIRTVCGKCTPRQKDMARMVLKHIYTYRQADFEKIMQIYDTDGKRNEILAFMNQ